MPIRDEELRALKETILKMASMVEVAIRDSVRSLSEKDSGMADRVIKNDHIVNYLDVKVDEECIRLIARRQPVGRDLRFITTGMKITTDLERIADHAVNIAHRSNELNASDDYIMADEIPHMREIAQGMVKDAIDAFVNEDKVLAREVILRDGEVDDLNSSIINELMGLMSRRPEFVPSATKLTYISRNLERIADHATNIAEMVIYMVEGRIIRHIDDINTLDL